MYVDTHPDDVARIADAAVRFATEGGRYEVIYRSRIKGTDVYRIIHAFGEHVYTDSGVRLAQVWYSDEGTVSESSEFNAADLNRNLSNALHEESALKASHYDFLTGLPNMTYFFERGESEKSAIENSGGEPLLMYIDFGGMKHFNSRYGFAEGDRLLKAFAKILAATFGNDNCCRIAGDHFTAITERKGIEKKLKRIFKESREIPDVKCPPVHVGIYQSRGDKVHISTACDRARLASRELKSSFASGFRYYTKAMSDKEARKQHIIENLDAAIQNRWIQVCYQPIIRSVNEKICDEEALARWHDPMLGTLSPAEFIPYLEEIGLIYKLDICVLEQVLEKMKHQQELGMTLVPHSINLSRVDFDVCDMVEVFRRRVDAFGIPHDKISIEITESSIGRDFDFMKDQVERFRNLGFPVWMDDFGSGYSSLQVLQSIPFDLIKFDMGFLRRLDEGESGLIILTELLKLATALGVDTVCEGVETEQHMRILQEIGCAKLQGYYFSRPQPPEVIFRKAAEGFVFGYENPEESSYYEQIGRVNLYDLTVIAKEDENSMQNAFNMVPMGIVEVRGDSTRFMRSNQSYRAFIKRFFGFDLSMIGSAYAKYSNTFMNNVVKTCCEQGLRSFYDEKMPNGCVVHSFARRVSVNPVNGSIAVAIAVLSITDPNSTPTPDNFFQNDIK